MSLKSKLGFMQGRLVNSEKKNVIQYFPNKNWKKEIIKANKHKFRIMEWTINYENIKKNPFYIGSKTLKKTFDFLKENKVKVTSVTCDFIMQKPFFFKKNFQTIIDLKKIIINSQAYGVKYFIVPLVDKSSLKKNFRFEKKIIDKLLILKKILNKDSKILFELDCSYLKVINFIKKFKSQKFGINYDTGNSASLGYTFNNEKKYFKYVHNIHIKDRKKYGSTVRLGYGDFDFKYFFDYLMKYQYNGNLILQTARAKKNNHIKELNINRKFVYSYL